MTKNTELIIYSQSSLFCLIKFLFMKKIIILMLIILGFTSCTQNFSRSESEVYVVENVTTTSTTMTFKFRGVNEPRTYTIVACQDGEGYPVYKKGDVVEIKNSCVSHIPFPTIWWIICPPIVCFIIGFLVAVMLSPN